MVTSDSTDSGIFWLKSKMFLYFIILISFKDEFDYKFTCKGFKLQPLVKKYLLLSPTSIHDIVEESIDFTSPYSIHSLHCGEQQKHIGSCHVECEQLKNCLSKRAYRAKQ